MLGVVFTLKSFSSEIKPKPIMLSTRLLRRAFSSTPRLLNAAEKQYAIPIPEEYDQPKRKTAGFVLARWKGNLDWVRNWIYGQQEYSRYGMYHDDLLEMGPIAEEAVRRLPEDVRMGRIHRLHRMIQCSRNKITLPKEMWTPIDHPNHFYLQPYIEEIEAEIRERAEWNSK